MIREKKHLQEKRKKRVRVKIRGTKSRPRATVFRSHKYIYAQIIDDEIGKTLISASEKELEAQDKKETKIVKAKKVGELLAQKALIAKIKKVVFDRGGYKYHGRVKALAEGAKEKGLIF